MEEEEPKPVCYKPRFKTFPRNKLLQGCHQRVSKVERTNDVKYACRGMSLGCTKYAKTISPPNAEHAVPRFRVLHVSATKHLDDGQARLGFL